MHDFDFSIELGATNTLGQLVGLTTQRADHHTILWSIAVAGQPNQYGAVVRKTVLRLAGCVTGSLAAIAAATEAAALLIRIAYRFQSIAHARLAGSDLDVPRVVRERCVTLEQESHRGRIGPWKVENGKPFSTAGRYTSDATTKRAKPSE